MHANAPWQDYRGAAGGFPESFMRSSSLGQRCAHDLLVDGAGDGRTAEEGTTGDGEGKFAAVRAARHSFAYGSRPSL